MDTIYLLKGISTSKRELVDIAIAWITIAVVMVVVTKGFSLGWVVGFVVSFLTVGIAFVVHELSHKIVAQKLGQQAEFRKFSPALIMSVVLAFLGITFVAPGAVVISGFGITNSENGKISLAGPLSNLVMGILAVIITLFLVSSFWKFVFVFTAYINCMIGMFNMIPFWILDGHKILVWSKKIYFTLLAVFLLLYIIIKFI